MTTENNLHLVWGSDGSGLTDPGIPKWTLGWVSEIPTYQQFNYLLNVLDGNMLSLAEKGKWAWNAAINYEVGATAVELGVEYHCIAAHLNQQPSGDAVEAYWVKAPTFGTGAGVKSQGLALKLVNTRAATTWGGNDITLENANSLVAYNSSTKNWLMGNVSGNLVAIDVDTTTQPDARNIAIGQPTTFKLFHEGNEPDVSQVVNAVEEAPLSGRTYARKGDTNEWLEVTSTTVSDEPPPPVQGAGQGWFNLRDGQFYIDIDDGDATGGVSAQWVPANPPSFPELIPYDNGTTGMSATDMQAAIDELHSLLP